MSWSDTFISSKYPIARTQKSQEGASETSYMLHPPQARSTPVPLTY